MAAADAPVKMAWGYGGSAMQMEGGWNQGGKGPSVFDVAYMDPAAHPTHGTPFRAADHYNRVKEDLGYLGQLGATAYRFSVSWPRILPNCTGTPNPEGIKFYSDMIDEIRRQGAEPFLTMYHWDLPQSCQDQFNGWQSNQIIDAFANYANVLFDSFGDRVDYWLTLNEPRANCDFCMKQPQFAPFTSTSEAVFYQCMHNSFLAHGTVVKNARARKDSATWKISLPSITDWHDPDPGATATSYYASTLLQVEWYFDPCFRGDYGPNIKKLFPLPTFTAAEQAMMKDSCDFIAVNMYNSNTNGMPALPPGESAPFTAQEVDDATARTYWPHPRPEGVRALPKYLYDRFNKDVVIAELGYHVPRSQETTYAQSIQDDLRVEYWRLNAPNLISLIKEDKVPVIAMLAWSLIDNYEFNSYEFRWGHIAVDYFDPVTGKVNTDKGSLKRTIKSSAFYMRDFFGNNTVSPFGTKQVKSSSTTTSAAVSASTGAAVSTAAQASTTKSSGASNLVAHLVETLSAMMAGILFL
ncbi:hypothetical protein HDU78_007410 [Chytriomyces hyalinus]|nr:hypothetical protein HDU78_007410 [Chytriomyces hyalinus]